MFDGSTSVVLDAVIPGALLVGTSDGPPAEGVDPMWGGERVWWYQLLWQCGVNPTTHLLQ